VFHEAEFVGVFARIDGDALALEGAEDAIGAVLLVQVFVVRVEVSALRVDSILGRLETVLCTVDGS